MKTKANEIVKELRDRADQILEWDAKKYGIDGKLMKEAADMIEDMDERIAIMSEPKCGEDDCDITFDGEGVE